MVERTVRTRTEPTIGHLRRALMPVAVLALFGSGCSSSGNTMEWRNPCDVTIRVDLHIGLVNRARPSGSWDVEPGDVLKVGVSDEYFIAVIDQMGYQYEFEGSFVDETYRLEPDRSACPEE